MSDTILIAVAWPYANAPIHVGNITGSHLPGDICARYHRLKGDRVLMVSGTDSHGTPVAIRADTENKTAEEVYQHFHKEFLDLCQQAGISYDLFTSTHTENHFKVSQALFLALKENGHLYSATRPQWYSPTTHCFLPDRYVEGTCYLCGFDGTRSDQCDRCCNVLEPEKLLHPRSRVDGSPPELRDTEHFFLDLSRLEPDIAEFLRQRQSFWRETVIGESLGKIDSAGLKPRPITRDLDWGIPVPVAGWHSKRLYVWFEAVIGYLSATIEVNTLLGHPGDWRDWWLEPSAKTIYFIGKDNIFFHAVQWPAQLKGAGTGFARIFSGDEGRPLNLPYNVPANQFMNLEGQKISGSRNWAVWGLDFLGRYDPDALRYYLTANMPELRDTDWDWADFVTRNNNELVATWGNLAHRVLSFAYKHWDGTVPTPGAWRPSDQAILSTVETGFASVGKLYDAIKLRAALSEVVRLATEVNRYLDAEGPWFTIKTDKGTTATVIYTALRCIDSLKLLFAPVLPFTGEKLHQLLGYQDPLFGQQQIETVHDAIGQHQVLRYNPVQASGHWLPSQLPPGQHLGQPRTLFKKLDEEVVEEERHRLGK